MRIESIEVAYDEALEIQNALIEIDKAVIADGYMSNDKKAKSAKSSDSEKISKSPVIALNLLANSIYKFPFDEPAE